MPLTNYRILVVEDEYMLAQGLRSELEDAGAVVIGPEPSVACALTCIAREDRIDAVVLDVNLGGEMAFPVADELSARQIPFLFASGYGDDVIKNRYPGVVNCAKPFVSRQLLRSLKSILH
ncbi:response regulator [Sphingomonas sanguinis]|jgi:DNA-binding response OmpR family regulator|uniref:response regulator n=1 Tax=Sphingomonas sp. LC-1 TaxID=3110957 RepID=UPI0021BA8125|nr:response regulator [Sphingomonas sp. LC-1]MCT8003387.1 response regulator [Sphingomonas sp. LC-1]